MKALIEQKRIARLKEVRAQEKEAASLLRNKVKKRREEHAKKLSTQLERDFEQNKENEYNVLEEEYQRRVNQIGTAHALNGKENYGIKKELSEKTLSDVKRRYKRACVQVLQEQAARNAPVLQREKWREKVNKMEEERKEEVLAQPKSENPDVISKLKPIRVGGVNSTRSTAETFLNTRYHLGESNFTWYPEVIVEKVSEEDQIDARMAADEEENRLKIAKELHDRQIEERKEKAEIRHLYAKNDVILKQEQYNLIEELKALELKDRTTRCETLKNIPKKVFQPPYQRYEEVKERRTQLEHAFENIYNVKKDDVEEFQLPNFVETKSSTTSNEVIEEKNSQVGKNIPEDEVTTCSVPATTKTLTEPKEAISLVEKREAIPLVEADAPSRSRDIIVDAEDSPDVRNDVRNDDAERSIVCSIPQHVLIEDDDRNQSSLLSSKCSSINLNSPAGSDSLVSMDIESACGSTSTHGDGNELLTDDMFATTRKPGQGNEQQDGFHMDNMNEYVKDRLANLQKQRLAGLQRNQVKWADDISIHDESSDVTDSHTTTSTIDFVVKKGHMKPEVIVKSDVVMVEDPDTTEQVESSNSTQHEESESDSTLGAPVEGSGNEGLGRESVFNNQRLLELSSRFNDKLNRLEKGTKSINNKNRKSLNQSSLKVSSTNDSSSSDHVATQSSDVTKSTVTDSSLSELGSERSLSKTMLELQRVRTKKEELRKDYSALIAKMQNYRTELQVKGERLSRRQTDSHPLTQINQSENRNQIDDDIPRQSSSPKQTQGEEPVPLQTRVTESETGISIPRPTVPPPPSSLDENVSPHLKKGDVLTHTKMMGNYSLDLSHPEIDIDSRLDTSVVPDYNNKTKKDSPTIVELPSTSPPTVIEPSIVTITTPSIIPPSLTSTSIAEPLVSEPRVDPITVAIPDVILPSMVVPNTITPTITLPSLLTISVPSVITRGVTAPTAVVSHDVATSAAMSPAVATSIHNVSISDIEMSPVQLDPTHHETDLSTYLSDDSSIHPESEPLHVITEALGASASIKLKPLKCIESPSTMYKSLPHASEHSPNRPPVYSNVSENLFESSKTFERSNEHSNNQSTFDDKPSPPFEYSSIMSLQEQRLSSAAGYPDTTETDDLTEISIREASRTHIEENSDTNELSPNSPEGTNGLAPKGNDAVSSPLISFEDPITTPSSGYVPIRNNMDIVLCDGDEPSQPTQFFPLDKWAQSVPDINLDKIPNKLVAERPVLESGNTGGRLSPGINTTQSTQSDLRVSNLDSATQSDLRLSQLDENDLLDMVIPVSTYPNVSDNSTHTEMKSLTSSTLIDILEPPMNGDIPHTPRNGDIPFTLAPSSIPPLGDHVQIFPPPSEFVVLESTLRNGIPPKEVSSHNSPPKEISPLNSPPKEISPYNSPPKEISAFNSPPKGISAQNSPPKEISPHNLSPTLSPLGISSQVTSLQLLPEKLQPESEALSEPGAALLPEPLGSISGYNDDKSLLINTAPSPTFTEPSASFTEPLPPVSEYLSELPATVSPQPLSASPATEVRSQAVECPLEGREPSALLSNSMDSLSGSMRYKEQLDLINQLSEKYRTEQRKIIESYEKLKEGLMSDSSVTTVTDRSHHIPTPPKESPRDVKSSSVVDNEPLLPGSHGDTVVSNIDGEMADDYQVGDVVHFVVDEHDSAHAPVCTAHDSFPELIRFDSQDSDVLDKKFMSMFEGLTTPDTTFFGKSVVVESDTIPTSICLTDVSFQTLPTVKHDGVKTTRKSQEISNVDNNDQIGTVQVDQSHENIDTSEHKVIKTSLVQNSTVIDERKNRLLMSFFQGMSPDITLVDHTVNNNNNNTEHSMFNFTQDSYRNLPAAVRNYADAFGQQSEPVESFQIEPVSGEEEILAGRLQSNQIPSSGVVVNDPDQHIDQSANQQSVFCPKFTQSSSPAYIAMCKQTLDSEQQPIDNKPSSIPGLPSSIHDHSQDEVSSSHSMPPSLNSIYLRGPIDSPSPIYNQASMNSEGTISELINLKLSSFSNDSVEVSDMLKVNQPENAGSNIQTQPHSPVVIESPTNQVEVRLLDSNRVVNRKEPDLPVESVSHNRSKPTRSDSDTSELFTVGKLKLTGTSNKKKSRTPKGIAKETLRLVTNGDGKHGNSNKKMADTSSGTSSTERSGHKADARDVKKRNPSGGLKKTKQGNGGLKTKKQVKFK